MNYFVLCYATLYADTIRKTNYTKFSLHQQCFPKTSLDIHTIYEQFLLRYYAISLLIIVLIKTN